MCTTRPFPMTASTALRVVDGAGADPSCLQAEVQLHPGPVASSWCDRTETNSQSHSLLKPMRLCYMTTTMFK